MRVSSPQRVPADALAGLLAGPACAAIAPDLRDALAAASDSGDSLRDTPAVLADTLSALSLLDSDGEVLAAAILHVAPGLQQRLQTRIARDFPAVGVLLEGQRAATQVWALHAERNGASGSEGLRRLLLAIVRDLRVVPILLARQLARMRHADALAPEQRRALAQLTRDIHAPLANRLGIWQLKWELEDRAFRHLEPEIYQRIARLLDDKRGGRERYIGHVVQALGEALSAQGLRAEVAGRPKHIYSIWKKMQKKNVPIGELYDLRAVRVLVDDIPACYGALGVVHALWVPVPSEFDDYIARPKRNDYRSLHTAVIGPEGKTLEVQIRTFEMHAQAELGVAAHWRYKEGKGVQHRSAAANAALDRKIEWMRRLLDTHVEGVPAATGHGIDGANASAARAADNASLLGEIDSELVEDRVYVLTPKGEVVDLPQGATPLDFAYHVHTEVGHRCRGAKVDGRIVPLDHVLHSGDRVEILVAKTGEPRRDWLVASNGFLASARSREKVRNWFNKLDRTRNVQAGRELLERELKRVGMHNVDPAPALQKFSAATLEDLQVQVALGDIGPHQVARALLEHERERERERSEPVHTTPSRAPRARKAPPSSAFTVVGMGNLLVQVARCCQPLPGEPIAGYLTRGRGVSVHRADCATLRRLSATQPQRRMPVEWGRPGSGSEAEVVVDAIDRKWLLKDVTNLIAAQDAHVLDIHTEAARGGGRLRLRLRLRVADYGQLSRLLGKLDGLPGVQAARRA
ncbi:RelA/SpoT family protein [Cognatiluteimonas telluris]|uniref:RelA/SpoT family protein n=1 Tax=Cognatiluteimonas telluris TaxID=1104775 RepID=UPI003CCD3A46